MGYCSPHIVIEGLLFSVDTEEDKLKFFDFLSSNAIVFGRPAKNLKFFKVTIEDGIEFRHPDATHHPRQRKKRYTIFTVKFEHVKIADDPCYEYDLQYGDEHGNTCDIEFCPDRPVPTIESSVDEGYTTVLGWEHSCILRDKHDKLDVVDWFIRSAQVRHPHYIPSDKLRFMNLLNPGRLPNPKTCKRRWGRLKHKARMVGREKVEEKKAKLKASVDRWLIEHELADWISSKRDKIKRRRLI